jgi:hypothetical protein
LAQWRWSLYHCAKRIVLVDQRRRRTELVGLDVGLGVKWK